MNLLQSVKYSKKRRTIIDAQDSPKLARLNKAFKTIYPDFKCTVNGNLYNFYYTCIYTNEHGCIEDNSLDTPRLKSINAIIKEVSCWLNDEQKELFNTEFKKTLLNKIS